MLLRWEAIWGKVSTRIQVFLNLEQNIRLPYDFISGTDIQIKWINVSIFLKTLKIYSHGSQRDGSVDESTFSLKCEDQSVKSPWSMWQSQHNGMYASVTTEKRSWFQKTRTGALCCLLISTKVLYKACAYTPTQKCAHVYKHAHTRTCLQRMIQQVRGYQL